MEEGMPYLVLTVTIVLLVLGIGTFAFYVTYDSVGFTEEQTEIFDVTNPSVDQTCSLSYYPEKVQHVYQYNGFDWVEIPSAG